MILKTMNYPYCNSKSGQTYHVTSTENKVTCKRCLAKLAKFE